MNPLAENSFTSFEILLRERGDRKEGNTDVLLLPLQMKCSFLPHLPLSHPCLIADIEMEGEIERLKGE